MVVSDDIYDEINIETSNRLLDESKPKPVACCPTDGEPLIFTLERSGAEFHCMVCGRWFGFLSPRPADSTPELIARHAELQTQFDRGVRGPI